MSGLMGWIDFTRELVRDRPLVTALTATMAPRGPDREVVWVSPHAALGVRTLDTGPAVAGQPYVTSAGGADVAAVVAGTPLGLTDLRDRLRAAGRSLPDSAGAAALVTAAYLEWGTDFVPSLGGAFAIALWDGRTEELMLARDQVGAQPLYYTHTNTGLVFASERKTLLAHPEVSPVVDVAGLRRVVSHALPPGPIFSGFAQVDAGEIAAFGRGGWRRRRYWQLTTRPHEDDVDTTVARIREMLEESVRGQLPADTTGVLATLSGGIDSSSVAALVAAELRRRGPDRLHAFTVDFAQEEFQPDVMRDTKDEPYARAVAERIGAQHTVVPLVPTDILDPVVRLGILRAKDGPARIYDMEASQYLFIQHLATQGAKVVFTGGAGDQLFQGARWSTDRGLIESGTFPWVALALRHGAKHGFGTALFNADVLATLDLPTYYRDEYATRTAAVEYLDGEDDWARQLRKIAYLVLTCGPLDSATFAAAGLEMRAPINNHRLIEYAYNIPAALHAHGGIEKGLLRAAVADLLPDEVVRRKQSATPVSKHPAYARRLQDELKVMLAEPSAPVRPLLDVAAATELANQPMRLAKDRLARAATELMLGINLWLDHYRVRLTL
ncbi:asparagine synthetase B [Actinomycetes bacterium KLBMP 9797]